MPIRSATERRSSKRQRDSSSTAQSSRSPSPAKVHEKTSDVEAVLEAGRGPGRPSSRAVAEQRRGDEPTGPALHEVREVDLPSSERRTLPVDREDLSPPIEDVVAVVLAVDDDLPVDESTERLLFKALADSREPGVALASRTDELERAARETREELAVVTDEESGFRPTRQPLPARAEAAQVSSRRR
jgi:hypothetical protein